MPPLLAEIVFFTPIHRSFHYEVPAEMDEVVLPGHRVYAPFGKRPRQMGIVMQRVPPTGTTSYTLKSITGLVDPTPVLSETDLDLARWLAEKTLCSLGEAAFTVCPLGRRPPPKRPPKNPLRTAETPTLYQPTGDQSLALEKILPVLDSGQFQTFLLQGVAASGKTEIYRRAISAILETKRGAILLVPEIGLTPQMEDRLRQWFGETLELWHSEMSDGERWRVWKRVKEGQARVVVGPRSAIFLPVTGLGVVIVDEEHDPSYKQDNTPRYHARDVAEKKARSQGAVLILGSATPTLETNARGGTDIEKIILSQRVENRPSPLIHVVDMAREGWYLSDPLMAAVKDRLEKKEQSLLFLNRRGYATNVACKICGSQARCPQCAVSLVYHKIGGESLRCHTCDHTEKVFAKCPTCGGAVIKLSGRGTERVAADIATLFPLARCLRWDRDTMTARHAHENAYRDVLEGRVDIIIGTQMIAQGHDFPNLTLVGVIDADRSLMFPDFRASERTFQLLMQVAGRAGRAERPGEVFIQTRTPGHYAMEAAVRRDYDAFATEELTYRRECRYPPFTRMVNLLLRSRQNERAETTADALVAWLSDQALPPQTEILGPAKAFQEKNNGWFQWQVVIKSAPPALPQILARLPLFLLPSSVYLSIDVDPN